MKNNEIIIYVVGGIKSLSVSRSLNKKYSHVYFFNEEINEDFLIEKPPQILIIEESEKSLYFLNRINKSSRIHVIYLSNNFSFNHVVKIIRKGVSDYILKDSCLYYSIQQSVNKLISLPSRMNHSFKRNGFIDSCAFRKRYPFRFKLIEWFG